MPILLLLLLIFLASTITAEDFGAKNQTFHPEEELNKLKMIRAHLDTLNKPALQTIQVPNHFQFPLFYFLCFQNKEDGVFFVCECRVLMGI